MIRSLAYKYHNTTYRGYPTKSGRADKFPIPQYSRYYIASKIRSDENLQKIFIEDCLKNHANTILCINCGATQKWNDIHYSIIGRTKKVIELCNDCAFFLSMMMPIDDIEKVPDEFLVWFKKLKSIQVCPICKSEHTWIKQGDKKWSIAPIPHSKFTEICQRCVSLTMYIASPKCTIDESVIRLKHLAELLGCIPDKDGYIFYQCQTLDDALAVLKEMSEIHSFIDLTAHYGSWLKVLIASGILPDGTRKTHFGTMVIAKDGCQCLSLAEKAIDDKLYAHKIPHIKEPCYPNSNFRADWEIEINGKKIFIEFFGLHGDKGYNKRMKEKLSLAEALGIEVIPFFPKDINSLGAAFEQKILSRLKPIM